MKIEAQLEKLEYVVLRWQVEDAIKKGDIIFTTFCDIALSLTQDAELREELEFIKTLYEYPGLLVYKMLNFEFRHAPHLAHAWERVYG